MFDKFNKEICGNALNMTQRNPTSLSSSNLEMFKGLESFQIKAPFFTFFLTQGGSNTENSRIMGGSLLYVWDCKI